MVSNIGLFLLIFDFFFCRFFLFFFSKTIDKVLARGDQIEELVDKTDTLQYSSFQVFIFISLHTVYFFDSIEFFFFFFIIIHI